MENNIKTIPNNIVNNWNKYIVITVIILLMSFLPVIDSF